MVVCDGEETAALEARSAQRTAKYGVLPSVRNIPTNHCPTDVVHRLRTYITTRSPAQPAEYITTRSLLSLLNWFAKSLADKF